VRVLVTGGSGGLGRYVVRALEGKAEVFAPSHKHVDITWNVDVLRFFCYVKPHVVVHLAAMANTAMCETHGHSAYKINARGTVNVVRACAEAKARLIYMSTDAVFAGEGPHPEDKTPSPDVLVGSKREGEGSIYGFTKLGGEQAVAALGNDGLIVRANFFTRHCNGKTSFAEYVAREARIPRFFHCYEGVVSTPVFAKTLAERIVQAVVEREHGILHVASSDSVNRVEQARMICEAYGLPTNTIVVDSTKASDGRLVAPRGVRGTVREEIAKMVKEEPL